MKLFLNILLLLNLFSSLAYCSDRPIFVIGQDVQSIHDYMVASKNATDQPDGFMVYTAINDMRGLWEPVDQGAGTNYADQILKEYPQMRVIQIGLYMRYMLKETLNGSFDKTIDRLGEWIKKTGKQVYLRIGYEFDALENEYDPDDYKRTYRYIANRLKAKGIKNLHFVWHTIAWRGKDWPMYEPLKWYPGDQYVDWVGVSFFDSKQDDERNAVVQLALKVHKPIMIAESSPFSKYSEHEKLEWMKKLFEFMKDNNIQFLSYINVDWDSLPMFAKMKWGDARLEKTPALMEEWLRRIKEFHQRGGI